MGELEAKPGYNLVQFSDGNVHCNVRYGTITLSLGDTGIDSIHGISIIKHGTENEIFVVPEESHGCRLSDGKTVIEMIIIPKSKRTPVLFKYRKSDKLWNYSGSHTTGQ